MGLLDLLNPFQADKPEEKPKAIVADVPQPVYTQMPGQVDPKITAHFEKLMEGANIPGPDYFEFKKALKAMTGVPEQMAFISTYTAFGTMGVTKEKLLSSIDVYIEVVNKDKVSFKASVDKKYASDVQSKEDLIVNNTGKINSLQQQIADLQAENIKLSNEVQNNKMAINNTQSGYEITAGEVIRQLEADKSKINQYIN